MIAIEGIPPSMYSGMETLNIAPSANTPEPNNRRGVQDSGQSSRQEPHYHHQNNITNPQDRPMAGTSSGGVSGGWSQKLKHRKEYTVLKKVVRVLQDNRMTNADQDATQRLHSDDNNGGGAGNDADSYPILKTILNVIFITTGVVLLVAVFVVIIYTSIVKPNPNELELMGHNYFNPADDELSFSNQQDTIPGDDSSDKNNQYPDYSRLSHPLTSSSLSSSASSSSSSSSSSDVMTKTSKQCRTIPMVEGVDEKIKFRELCFNVPLQAPQRSTTTTIHHQRRRLRSAGGGRKRHFRISPKRT